MELGQVFTEVFGKGLESAVVDQTREHTNFTEYLITVDGAPYRFFIFHEPKHSGTFGNWANVALQAADAGIGLKVRASGSSYLVLEHEEIILITPAMLQTEEIQDAVIDFLRRHHRLDRANVSEAGNRFRLGIQLANEAKGIDAWGVDDLVLGLGVFSGMHMSPLSVCNLNLRPGKWGITPDGRIVSTDFQCAAVAHAFFDSAKICVEAAMSICQAFEFVSRYNGFSESNLARFMFCEAAITALWNIGNRPGEAAQWIEYARSLMHIARSD